MSGISFGQLGPFRNGLDADRGARTASSRLKNPPRKGRIWSLRRIPPHSVSTCEAGLAGFS